MKDIRQFKNIISKTLQQSTGKGKTAEQVSEAIVAKIELAMEVMEDMGGMVPIIGSPTPAPPQDVDTKVDISTRLRQAGEEPAAGLVEKYTTDQLVDFAKNMMPSSLWVKPLGFENQFEIKKTVEAAPGDIGYVRITYAEPGAVAGPTISISTTDQALDADALTVSIQNQANSIYTTQKRVLTPKMPALNGSPGDLSRALSAEAPDSAANYDTWLKNTSQPDQSQTWKGLRERE